MKLYMLREGTILISQKKLCLLVLEGEVLKHTVVEPATTHEEMFTSQPRGPLNAVSRA